MGVNKFDAIIRHKLSNKQHAKNYREGYRWAKNENPQRSLTSGDNHCL